MNNGFSRQLITIIFMIFVYKEVYNSFSGSTNNVSFLLFSPSLFFLFILFRLLVISKKEHSWEKMTTTITTKIRWKTHKNRIICVRSELRAIEINFARSRNVTMYTKCLAEWRKLLYIYDLSFKNINTYMSLYIFCLNDFRLLYKQIVC